MTSPQYISFNLTSNKFICTCSAMLSTIIANFQMKTTYFSGIPCLTIVDRLLGGCLHSESYLAAHWPKVTQISLKLKLLTFWHLLEISLSSSFTAIWVTLDELRACVCVSARAHVCVANFWLTFKQWTFLLYETRVLDDLMAKKISNKRLDDFCSGVVKQSCAHAHSSIRVES